MAETTTALEPTKVEEPTSILMTKEPEITTPEKTLFKPALTVEDAKAAAIKELADKETADAVKKVEEPVKDAKAPTEPAKTPDKATTPVPTDYTLDLPENSALAKEDLEATLKEAKASGLSVEKAKELLQSKDQVARSAQTRLQQKQEQDLKSMVTGWRESVKKDPELGGEKLAATAIKASRAFKAVASPAMQEFCNKTGYADHPEMVRMMLKIHDLIGEDKFIKGSTGGQSKTPTTMEEKAKKLFGNPVTTA